MTGYHCDIYLIDVRYLGRGEYKESIVSLNDFVFTGKSHCIT